MSPEQDGRGCLPSPRLVGGPSRLTQKAQEGQVVCGSELPEALVHVQGNLPGVMWTAAPQVCPEGVSETSSRVDPDLISWA